MSRWVRGGARRTGIELNRTLPSVGATFVDVGYLPLKGPTPGWSDGAQKWEAPLNLAVPDVKGAGPHCPSRRTWGCSRTSTDPLVWLPFPAAKKVRVRSATPPRLLPPSGWP